MTINNRLRAVCDLSLARSREGAGLHEYDGEIQDLSESGVRAGLQSLRTARAAVGPLDDPHDEKHLSAFEDALVLQYEDLELHRRDPLRHLDNLELSAYVREYAPEPDRLKARARQLEQWPEAVDIAVTTLDQVNSPTAKALLGAARGQAAAVLPTDGETGQRALAALSRLVGHLEHAAEHGDPDAALGGPALARLMGVSEGLDVDLGRLALTADAERDRLWVMLTDACAALDPSRTPRELVPELLADHPDADGVLSEARSLTAEVLEFTRTKALVPHLDGECLVGPTPESLAWSTAMMAWSAPGEADAPSWYWVTPPGPELSPEEAEEWLTVFSRTALPAITVHEVAPGHFTHGRSLRRAPTDVRRILHSSTFAEGWAHHMEEVCMEEGFREDDPRFTVGVCLEALIRVTRLACAIGLHTGAMDVAEATRRFMSDALMERAGAASEARRGTFDPTYGQYTWGKLALRDLRDRARRDWGSGWSNQRFHAALMDLGSPPLGLIGTAVERG
jgi:hypothetical protein